MGIDIEGSLNEAEERFITIQLMVVCLSDDWNPSDYEIENYVCETLLISDKSNPKKYASLVTMLTSQIRNRIGMIRSGVSTFGPTSDVHLILEKLIPKEFVIYREENTLFGSGGNVIHYVALGNKMVLGKVLKICNLGESLKNVIGKKGDKHGENDN